jgi:Fic family protein
MDGMWGRVQAELEAREGRQGLSPYDLLEMPRAQRNLLKKLLKQRVISLADAAAELEQPEATAERTLGELVEKTYLVEFEKKGIKHYKLLLARKEGKELPFNVWDDLTQKLEE